MSNITSVLPPAYAISFYQIQFTLLYICLCPNLIESWMSPTLSLNALTSETEVVEIIMLGKVVAMVLEFEEKDTKRLLYCIGNSESEHIITNKGNYKLKKNKWSKGMETMLI